MVASQQPPKLLTCVEGGGGQEPCCRLLSGKGESEMFRVGDFYADMIFDSDSSQFKNRYFLSEVNLSLNLPVFFCASSI